MAHGSISVALTTYNAGPFLAEQLESLLWQSRPPEQLVIRDDGSTDGTWEALKTFASKAPFEVDLVKNPVNLGVIRNFESAVSACVGDYVALCDQDDIWEADKLEALCGALDVDTDKNLAFSDAALIDTAGQPLGVTAFDCVDLDRAGVQDLNSGVGLRRLRRRHTMVGATAVYRRSCHRMLLPFPQSLRSPGSFWIHDGWIAAILSAVGGVHVEERPLVRYRIHPGQAVGLIFPADRTEALPRPTHRGGARRAVLRTQLSDELAQISPVADRLVAVAATQPGLHDLALGLSDEAVHYRARLALPDTSMSRSLAVLREARRGGYRRHARGLRSIAADLLGR